MKPDQCPITGETRARKVFAYDKPPIGETYFGYSVGNYHREVWQFQPTGHYVSVHAMGPQIEYSGEYVTSTYSDIDGIRRSFSQVRNLPAEGSDNSGRLQYLTEAQRRFGLSVGRVRLLDVGSGIGIFPYSLKDIGWDCLALDPDPKAIEHMRQDLGLNAVCAGLESGLDIGQFHAVTMNKVLEHVVNPIALLSLVHEYLSPGGLAYVEVPDGQAAEMEGPEREEFYVDHLHVFSDRSLEGLIKRSGLDLLAIEQLQEPSSKFTLRGLCRRPDSNS